MKKRKALSKDELEKMGRYKGYSIGWLRGVPEHPDHHLVAEWDKKFGEKGK